MHNFRDQVPQSDYADAQYPISSYSGSAIPEKCKLFTLTATDLALAHHHTLNQCMWNAVNESKRSTKTKNLKQKLEILETLSRAGNICGRKKSVQNLSLDQ